MTRIYFVRHGENLANLTKEFSYRKVDYPLTEKGVLQAQQTAEFLAARPVRAVYSSPLKRATQTASIIAEQLHLPVHVEENLREVNVGNLEGQPVTQKLWDDHNAIIHAWRAGQPETRFPGGENQNNLAWRFSDILKHIVTQERDRQVVVVGHGGLFTFGLPLACPRLMLDHVFGIPNHNCSISIIDLYWEDDNFEGQLQAWADVGHISGEAADFVHGYVQRDELGMQNSE